jgi:4-hydroxythreonine-4-phosphate dehydrogenase
VTEQPVVGLMLGDATGIGPEVCAKVLAQGTARDRARIVVVGDARVLAMGAGDAGLRLDWRAYDNIDQVDWTAPEVPVVDLRNLDPATFARGKSSPEVGRITGETLRYMIEIALEGKLHGVCFAPLNKGALYQGGWKYYDEHQMFAALLRHQGYFGEMNVLDGVWTSRVTSHVGFKEVINLITPERLDNAIRLAYDTVKASGIAQPRIAVAALNPHAGDNGLFGDEEIRLIRPAVERAIGAGIDCDGPFPADAVFLRAFNGRHDAVVAMYHDQSQIAMKLMGFSKGIAVTAGLKTVFTTPAHGTAYDLVGQGKAITGPMENALRMAVTLAAGKLH